MKVADLFALLSFKTDKRSMTKALGDTKALARTSDREFKKMATQTESHFKRVGRSISQVMRRAAADTRKALAGAVAGGAGKRAKAGAGIGGALLGGAKRYGGLALTAGFALGTRDSLKFTEALGRLNITAKGGLGTLGQLRDRLLDVSNETGVNKENVLRASSRYIELTGNVKAAKDNMELFAKVQQATGASADDIAGSAAAFVEQFKIASPEMEKMFSIAIEGGKAGSAEFKDMAAHLAGLGAQLQEFSGGAGLRSAATLSALMQKVTARAGGNTAEATTQIQALMTEVASKEGAARLKSQGVNVYKNGELRNFFDIMKELKSKDLKDDILADTFRNVRSKRAALGALRDDWEGLTEATLNSNATAEDYAEIMQNNAIKVKKAWNRFKNFMLVGFSKVVDAMGWLVDHSRLIVIAITVLIGAFISLKAVAIAAAIRTAAAWAVAMAPLILMGILIAAIILLIEDIWVAFHGGKSITGDAYKWLVDVFVEAIEFWVEQFEKFFGWIVEKFEWIANKAKAVMSVIDGTSKGGLRDALDSHQRRGSFSSRAKAVKNAFATVDGRVPVASGGSSSNSTSMTFNVQPGGTLDRSAVPAIRGAALDRAARQAETESY